MKDSSWIWLIAAAAALYYWQQQQQSAASTTASVALQPTPYSIYPSMASMATTTTQQASTTIQPTTLYSAMQSQNVADIMSQCAGSYPGCSPLLADTQLGL